MEPKIPYLGVLESNSERILSFRNQRPQISLIPKFGAETKILKFETKIAWFGSFSTEILKNYSLIWNPHSRTYLIVKFREKTKMPKLGNKNALFGYYFAGNWKQHCHTLNQHPQIFLIAKFCEKK